MDSESKKSFALGLILVVLTVVFGLPAAMIESTGTHDEISYIANGAFFISLISELPAFLGSPVEWVVEYYERYPGFSIRRSGPLFGLVEAGFFSLIGISVVSAKLTLLSFTVLWVLGFFLLVKTLLRSDLIGFLSSVAILSLPVVRVWGETVRLDIPSLVFVVWGAYFLSGHIQRNDESTWRLLVSSICFAASLYVYSLPVVSLVCIFSYLLVFEFSKIRIWPPSWHIKLGFATALFSLPILIYLGFLDTGMFVGAISGNDETLTSFTPVSSKTEISYWTYYLNSMLDHSVLAIAALVLWPIAKVFSPPKRAEWFFVVWFVLGYLLFSVISIKGSRYEIHFVPAAIPLFIVAIRDLIAHLVKWETAAQNVALGVVAGLSIVFSNSTFASIEPRSQVSGIDTVAKYVAEECHGRVLYVGEFDRVFSFYIRKYDEDRSLKVDIVRARVRAQGFADVFDQDGRIRDVRGRNEPFLITDRIQRGEFAAIIVDQLAIHTADGKFLTNLQGLLFSEETSFQKAMTRTVRYGPAGQDNDVLVEVFASNSAGCDSD